MRVKSIVVLIFLLFSVSSGQAANEKVLYSFTGGADGSNPNAGVVFDQAGNLYGVTVWGGAYGQGAVFQLTPSPSGTWTETVLYNFTGGTDGGWPIGGLAIDEYGFLYGTTATGGDPSSQCGTVFALSPARWNFKVLHAFTGGKDGCSPQADLYYDGLRLYGTTTAGGSDSYGTTFMVWTSGDEYWAWYFLGTSGRFPLGGVNGLGYGTTYDGGKDRKGTIFELSWGHNIKLKYAFNASSKVGYLPVGNLATQSVGGVWSMYGTTSAGGVGKGGTVYRLTESQSRTDTWVVSVLHSFSGPDGDLPFAGPVLDRAGNLYGTTVLGGSGRNGTVYRLMPGSNNQWTHTVLYGFTNGTDGGQPGSGVVLDDAGNLYGTTFAGGAYHQGVVYEIVKTTAMVKPASLTFGPQPLLTTSPAERISLFNISTLPLEVTSVNLQGDFAVSANKCQNGVQPNTHCDIYVTFTPTGTSTRPRTGTITFVDSAFNGPQSAQLSGTVPSTSKTLVTTSGSPSFLGQTVTFAATVTSMQGTIPDGGLVTFSDGATTLGSAALANGVAAYTTSALSVKTHTIKATYAGDPAFEPSTGSVAQVVEKYPTTAALSSTPNPSGDGQVVTFTATVTSAGPTATGKVWFKDGTTAIGSVTLSGGVATLTKSKFTVGTHPITAQYLGDSANGKSTSAVLNQVVQ